MRYLVTATLCLFLALPLRAQSNVLDVVGNTTGASADELPLFGSTSASCTLFGTAEPFVTQLFFVDTAANYQFDVVEPISVIAGTDDTMLLLYENSFDPTGACTNFSALGNQPPGSGLNAALTSAIQYVLVVGGFFGTEDAFQVRITGPDGSTVSSGVIPVELVSFEVVRDGDGVLLRWATASETNNAGFLVERGAGSGEREAAWQQLGFVEGRGTTLEPQQYTYRVEDLAFGRHVYRLKQIDFDGAFEYSPEVEITVEMAERFVLEAPYPNPFNPSATVRFALREAQPIRVGLYDALGRLVTVLYEGTPAAGAMVPVEIDGQGWPSGIYFVRLTGEDIEATRRVTLLK